MSMVSTVSVIKCLLLVWLLHSKDPRLHFLQTDVLSTPFNAEFDDFHSPYLGYFYTTIQRRKLCHASMYSQCSLRERSGCDCRGLCNSKMAAQYSHTGINSLLIDTLSTCDLCLALERVMVKKNQFSWTDDETELLLNTTLEYKTEKIANGTNWESVRSKYGDIWKQSCPVESRNV